jgi:hypothetical protein
MSDLTASSMTDKTDKVEDDDALIQALIRRDFAYRPNQKMRVLLDTGASHTLVNDASYLGPGSVSVDLLEIIPVTPVGMPWLMMRTL